MQWTFVFCILISSAIIASSYPEESRHKRSLSFFKSLFFNHLRRTHGKCTNTSQCKQTSAFSDQQKNGLLSVSENGRDENKRKRTRTKVPKRAGNNGSSSVTNVANDPYQAESQDLGTPNTLARTSTKNANRERPKNRQKSDTELIDNSESVATNTPKNLNIDKNIYDTPIIYAYGQPYSETVQTFVLDNNSDFIVPENVQQLPMPGYVGDGLGNIIWSVPPYPHQRYPSFASQQYEDSIMSPYVLLDHQQGNLGMNVLPNNHISVYTGKPIIVCEDISEKIKMPKLFQDCEVNKEEDRKSEQKPRGDIPD